MTTSKITMEAIKAKLAANKEKSSGGAKQSTNSTGDNASYQFWKIPEGSSATVRFLPDKDQNNPLFWVKREVIKMPFAGSVGGEYATNKRVMVQVPCIDMFDMSCPIIAATKKWWDDPQKKDLARVYWKKKSYIFQGFVVTSPFDEQNVPENPIRRFTLNTSIYDIVEQSMMDVEMVDAPTDYINGCDFNITKTTKGQYANYTTSKFRRNTRTLSEIEQTAIEQHGLFNLKDYLGRVPDNDEIEAIKAMFQDSLDGKPFDTESYGKYYRAFADRDAGGGYSDNDSDNDSVVTQAVARTAPVSAPQVSAPEVNTPSYGDSQLVQNDAPKPSADDILARIRARKDGN